MSTPQEQQDFRQRAVDALTNFLQKYRRVFGIALIVLAVGLVALFAYVQIHNARVDDSLTQVEELQTDYQDWLNAEEEQKADLESSILEDAESIIQDYSGFYAASRALHIRANVHWEEGRVDKAVQDFQRLADEYRNSYLAPLALYNAASGLEETGKPEAAANALSQLVERYADSGAPEVPRALFSLGRIAEQQQNYEQAAEHYRRLSDEYGNSSWTNLAKDRMIWLSTQGMIESESSSSS